MNKSKTVNKNIAIIVAVAISIIMAVTSVVCTVLGADRNTDNNTYLTDAKGVVTDFVNNESYNNFTFMDSLFAKANIVSTCVDEQTNVEITADIAKNLSLNSFIVTDPDGKIINATDADKIGTNILDDKNTNQFKKVLKGIAYKSTTEPKAVEGENGIYNVMACVTRSTGGVVVIDIDTDTYTLVTGENLAKSCKGNTIIAKDGNIISSNFDIAEATELKNLGINEDNLKADAFTVTVDDINYSLSAEKVDDYTVISGAVIVESGFNYIFGAIIPIAVCAVMILLSVIVFTISAKKQEIQ